MTHTIDNTKERKTMSMTRKDFEAIAAAIKPLAEYHHEMTQFAAHSLVCRLLPVLDASNPRFDALRFVKACGISPKYHAIKLYMAAKRES